MFCGIGKELAVCHAPPLKSVDVQCSVALLFIYSHVIRHNASLTLFFASCFVNVNFPPPPLQKVCRVLHRGAPEDGQRHVQRLQRRPHPQHHPAAPRAEAVLQVGGGGGSIKSIKFRVVLDMRLFAVLFYRMQNAIKHLHANFFPATHLSGRR